MEVRRVHLVEAAAQLVPADIELHAQRPAVPIRLISLYRAAYIGHGAAFRERQTKRQDEAREAGGGDSTGGGGGGGGGGGDGGAELWGGDGEDDVIGDIGGGGGEMNRMDLSVPLRDVFSERAAITALRVAIERQLLAYPTTIQHDEDMLSDVDLPAHMHHCVVLRLGEKGSLTYYTSCTAPSRCLSTFTLPLHQLQCSRITHPHHLPRNDPSPSHVIPITLP